MAISWEFITVMYTLYIGIIADSQQNTAAAWVDNTNTPMVDNLGNILKFTG